MNNQSKYCRYLMAYFYNQSHINFMTLISPIRQLMKLLSALVLGMSLSSITFAANTDPLVGTWKTIDDRTGYSLSDVIIRQDSKTKTYSATILHARSVPGAEHSEICTQCKGSQKNQRLVGLKMLSGLNPVPNKQNEFHQGQLLDPSNGQLYNARARLMNNGKHLIIYSQIEGHTVGRNMTWVKY